MAFHPDRLTGRRARQWRKSVHWRARPDAPATLLAMLRRPDLLRAWGRTKAADGTFHYVCLVRDRVVFPTHLIDHTRARRLRATMEALGGDARGLTCRACDEILGAWRRPDTLERFDRLPAGLREAVKARRPGVEQEVVGVRRAHAHTWSSRTSRLPVWRASPADHPTPWVEPPTPAARWVLDRRENGHPPESVRSRLAARLARVVAEALGDHPTTRVTVHDRSRPAAGKYGVGWASTSECAGNTCVAVSRDAAAGTADVSVHVYVNVFNWYVRAYTYGRHRCGDWLVLVPARGPDRDSAVICDAVSVRAVAAAVASTDTAKSPDPKSVPLTHGILHPGRAGWEFTPAVPDSANRVKDPDQLIPVVVCARGGSATDDDDD